MKELIRQPTVSVSRDSVEAALRRLMRQPGDERLRGAMRMVEEYAATLHTSRVYARIHTLVAQAFVDAALAKQDGYELVFCVQVQDVTEFFKFFGPDAGLKNFKNFFYEGREARVRMGLIEIDRVPTICTQTNGTQSVRTQMDRVRTVSAQNVRVPDDVPDVVEPSPYEPVVVEPSVDDPSAAEPSVPEPLTNGSHTLPVGKLCTRCGQTLPLDAYSRHRGRADGYASACRPCEGARKRKGRAPQPEATGPV